MKKIPLLFLSFLFSISIVHGQGEHLTFAKKTIVGWKDTTTMEFIRDHSLYADGWDTIPQTVFWREIINMTSDTCVINIASCRKPVDKISRMIWMNQTEPEKICFKDSVNRALGLDSATNLFITAGKGEFYETKKVMPDIDRAIRVFQKNDCDPWYAQAILLIESPGKLSSKSYVGAKGPFQLMRSVALKYGLRVNRHVDERTDLVKSARAASRLINAACIPYVKEYLDDRCIEYTESDLWFRLLVLHAYHAGAGNVRCVIDAIDPSAGGLQLFQQIWQTECGRFKNESQNYSQIALASLLNFDRLIDLDGDTVFLVQGDKLMKDYKRQASTWETYDYLQRCMAAYEKDFVDDMISYDYFMKRISFIRQEFAVVAKVVIRSDNEVTLKNYPSSEAHLNSLAAELTKRQRYEDAIRMLKLNLDIYPESVSSYDSIARLYRLTGDVKQAEFYSARAGALQKDGIKGSN